MRWDFLKGDFEQETDRIWFVFKNHYGYMWQKPKSKYLKQQQLKQKEANTHIILVVYSILSLSTLTDWILVITLWVRYYSYSHLLMCRLRYEEVKQFIKSLMADLDFRPRQPDYIENKLLTVALYCISTKVYSISPKYMVSFSPVSITLGPEYYVQNSKNNSQVWNYTSLWVVWWNLLSSCSVLLGTWIIPLSNIFML